MRHLKKGVHTHGNMRSGIVSKAIKTTEKLIFSLKHFSDDDPYNIRLYL